MQEVKQVDFIIEECLRIASRIIIGFPNFAYVGARWMLFFRGKAPITASLPYRWYDTPNVRFLSISDFRSFCADKHLRVLEACYLGNKRRIRVWPNLFAESAIFMVAKDDFSESHYNHYQ
jgi:methionine biosynthesis protein MetW